jgi:uncharacterized protein YdeI (YjbR/CyaY-like superfamily)
MPAKNSAPGLRDPRVDAYIAKAPPFAVPILEHVRAAMHAACPELDETMKWSRPFFELDGRVFAGMAAFKAHCAVNFWRGRGEPAEAIEAPAGTAMARFGHVESLADLPSAAALRKLVAAAAKEVRAKHESAAPASAAVKRTPRPPPTLPDDLATALRTTPTARKGFDAFTPGQQREYVEWIVEARRAATRAARIAQAVEWMAEGKTRNWKYGG